MLKFALAGNPNCGKTTLFNHLTGSTAHVGNWPGVTVDKREGLYKKLDSPVSIVDLPGIYSLSPYTQEEVISRNFILNEKPDCVINIVDVTNFERNLYLTTQLMEIDVPVVVALNMMDMLEKQGDKIDAKLLEQRLGIPVVKISALKSDGLDQLMQVALKATRTVRKGKTVLENCEISHLIKDVTVALDGQDVADPLFHAVKLVENDELEVQMHPNTIKTVEKFKQTYNNDLFGTDLEALVADARYKYITKYYSPALTKNKKGIQVTPSDKIDKVLTSKWLGIPIFLVILFTIFHLTFSENLLYIGSIFNLPKIDDTQLKEGFNKAVLSCFYDGAVYSPGVILFNLMELITGSVFGFITNLIESAGASTAAVGLVDSVFAGIGGVLSFVPQVVFLLLLLSILEDTGYMARVAFILDRIFRKFGVSGRAFIPMVMGFGCSVPAIVNTRTLADERERILTIRTIPFFTCGAKLPILIAIAGAIARLFGSVNADIITYSMYVLGVAVAVVSIIVMRSTTQRGEISPVIMELPTYRAPSAINLARLVWDKTKHYIEKVFTVILASSVLIWFLSNFGWDWKMVEIENSILSSIGKFVQPLFTPLGFGSQLGDNGWVFVVAAVTGLIAKENVVATFGAIAACFIAGFEGTEEGALEVVTMVSKTGITWQGLIAFIAFNMTTIPCFASVAAAKGELGKGKKTTNTIIFWLFTSFLTSTIVYLVLSWWWTSFIVVGLGVVTAIVLREYNKKHPLPPQSSKQLENLSVNGCNSFTCASCRGCHKYKNK